MILPGSYANGFAPRDGQPLYPEVWRGCVGAWAPCLGPTGLALRDWSGFANHGTLTNMDPVTDWTVNEGRYVLDFGDTDDRVLATLLSGLEAPYTISLWHYTRSLIVTTMWFSSASQEFGLDGSSRLILQRNGAYAQFVNNGGTITLNRWEHVAVVMSSSKTVSYYRNGINTTTGNADMSALAVGFPTDIRIGSNGLSGRRFDGMMDGVMIYKRALQPQDIRLLASRRGIAYELAPRRRSRIAVITSGFSTLRPSILRGSR